MSNKDDEPYKAYCMTKVQFLSCFYEQQFEDDIDNNNAAKKPTGFWNCKICSAMNEASCKVKAQNGHTNLRHHTFEHRHKDQWSEIFQKWLKVKVSGPMDRALYRKVSRQLSKINVSFKTINFNKY